MSDQPVGAEWSAKYAKTRIREDAVQAFDHLEKTVTKIVSKMDSLSRDLKADSLGD